MAEGRVGPARRVPRAEVARYLVAAWKMKAMRQACDLEGSPEEVAGQEGLDPALLKRWAAFLDARRRRARRVPLAPWSEWIARLKQVPEGGADEASLHEVEQAAGAFQEHVLTLLARRERVPPRSRRPAAVARKGRLGQVGPRWGEQGPARRALRGEGRDGRAQGRVEKLLPDESRARLSAMRSEMERMKKRPRRATRWCIP